MLDGKGNDKDYFIKRKSKLLKSFDKAAKHFKTVLRNHVCGESSEEAVGEIRKEFLQLIPTIPYITNNKFSVMVSIECAQYIAMYRVLRKRGISTEECGRMVVLIAEERLKPAPKVFLRLFGRFIHTAMGRRWIKKTYVESLDKPDSPYRFRSVYLPASGKEYDFGVDFFECGLRRYFNEQDADDLMPYICLIDHVQARIMGIGLRRTETLASGGSRCDFRWKKGWQAQPSWPPPWLKKKS